MAIEWQVENVRLSLFSSQAVQVTEADWQLLTGQQMADTRQAIPGGHVFTGPYQEAQLSLAGASNRADVIMASAPPDPSEEPSLPTFGLWTNVLDKFVALTKNWKLGERFPVVRIAFGAVLLSKADDRVDAYKQLKEMLRTVTVSPEEMRDLVYRVNWPLESKNVKGLTINRITNWSALQIQISQLAISSSSQTATSTTSTAKHAIRLELDHNTEAGWKEPFSAEVVANLYEELIQLASENSNKGERP